MAKKKDFENIVEESFKEGYTSEPNKAEEKNDENPQIEVQEPVSQEPENLSENELLLRSIVAGEKETLEKIWEKEDRSTYYLTDVHRACIDIMAHNEGIKKNDIVTTALNEFFSEEIREAAKDRVVTMAIKKLEREIKKENK